MSIANLIFGLDKKESFEKRKEQIFNFQRNEVIPLLDKLIAKQKSEDSKQILIMMRQAISNAVIKGYPSDALVKGEFGRVLGTNQKIIAFNPKTKRYKIISPDIISIPQYHLFHKNKLTERGKLTMLHEFAHTITPSEFRADMIAVELAAGLGISKAAIVSSIAGRRYALGAEKFRELVRIAESL